MTDHRDQERPATLDDLHQAALAMPDVTVSDSDHPVYQVGGKSFLVFRTPRGDALDEDGTRLTDVIVIWVGDQDDKAALLAQPGTPLFTTDHFAGHSSVLVRASRIGELSQDEARELVTEAWLARASKTSATRWLADHNLPTD